MSREVLTLEEAHAVFRRWLGDDYDLDALNAMLATVAVERLDGDPLWLLIISGSGNAKTETVVALDGIGATVTSTISSTGALLSATAKQERTKDATGGLLRAIGSRGVLVIKDVTSILSMGREMRTEVLGAIREIHDGRWSRNVGTDGGRTLEWTGPTTSSPPWETGSCCCGWTPPPDGKRPAGRPSPTPGPRRRCASSSPRPSRGLWPA
jgi:microcompartment protein CcmK/EutM